jgi:hypothetical protein
VTVAIPILREEMMDATINGGLPTVTPSDVRTFHFNGEEVGGGNWFRGRPRDGGRCAEPRDVVSYSNALLSCTMVQNSVRSGR